MKTFGEALRMYQIEKTGKSNREAIEEFAHGNVARTVRNLSTEAAETEDFDDYVSTCVKMMGDRLVELARDSRGSGKDGGQAAAEVIDTVLYEMGASMFLAGVAVGMEMEKQELPAGVLNG